MIFKALKHKIKPNTFAEPYAESLESGFYLRETSMPLLQPLNTTMEGIRKAYEEGPYPAEKALAQLDDYELVELHISTVDPFMDAKGGITCVVVKDSSVSETKSVACHTRSVTILKSEPFEREEE